MSSKPKVAVIGGVGTGLGLVLSRRLLDAGYHVGAIARSESGLNDVAAMLQSDHFHPVACDLGNAKEVDHAFLEIESRLGEVSTYIHNAARLLHQPFMQTGSTDFEQLWRVICLGAVNGTQRALPGMLSAGRGEVLYIGATASVKGGAEFTAFSSAKFALRGLAQSLARELGPQGIHVGHIIIDGIIWSERIAEKYGLHQRQCLDPDAVAASCLHLLQQPRSAWSHELDLRPDVEPF